LGKEAGQELGEHQSDRDPSIWLSYTHVTEDTTNTVGGENIEGIVVSKGELELGRKVANGAGHETEKDGGGCAGKTYLRMSATSLDP
jgi:hypothetical protein